LFKFACGEQRRQLLENEKSPAFAGLFDDFYSTFISNAVSDTRRFFRADLASAAVTSGPAVSQVFGARHLRALLRAVLGSGESGNCGHGGDRQGESQCDFGHHGRSPLLYVDGLRM